MGVLNLLALASLATIAILVVIYLFRKKSRLLLTIHSSQ